MNKPSSPLADAARRLAEKKQQEQQLEVYALRRKVEQLESEIAVYKHEALLHCPLGQRESVLQEAAPLPQTKKRELIEMLKPVTPRWLRKKVARKTILIIDNGGMADTIEKLSVLYHVIVWSLKGSTQPMPPTARVERFWVAQFNETACSERIAALIEADSPLCLILVDGFIWQAPLVAAARHYVPVVLCFDQPIDRIEPLHWAGMYSRWRIQQSFLWSIHILCAHQQSVDFFLAQQWLPFTDFTQVVEKEQRDHVWWVEQVDQWLKHYQSLLQQSDYLQKQNIDKSFFLGYQHWDEHSTYQHKMMNFLLRWRLRFEARQLIPGFDMVSYEQHHPLLQGINPTVDFLKKGRPEGPWSWPVIQPNTQAVPDSERVALHIHAYYIDRLPTIMTALMQNQLRPVLYISVKNDDEALLAQAHCAEYNAPVYIRTVPNKGRDIGAFLTAFGQELVEQYDIIGHVHTKQSLFHPHRDFITAWQEFLFTNVLGKGEQRMADAIVHAMQKDPQIGIVFPDDPNILDWGENKDYAELLMHQLGMAPEHLPARYFKFPVGTMFWIRSQALKPLVQLGLEWDDYPDEPLIQDGSILHALERVFGILPQLLGLKAGLSHTPGVSR